jgi:hypothetical protein
VLHLLGLKVDSIKFLMMYGMNNETTQIGTEFHVKFELLVMRTQSCAYSRRCRLIINLVWSLKLVYLLIPCS